MILATYKAMKYYFEKTKARGFSGQQRTSIVTTINKDIKRTISKVRDFEVMELKTEEFRNFRRNTSSRSGQNKTQDGKTS